MTNPSEVSPHPRRSMDEINKFIADGERSAASMEKMIAENVAPKRVVRAGTGRRKAEYVLGSGDQFTSSLRIGTDNRAAYVADTEFPDGGDPRFRKVLSEMLKLHISKSHDYGTGRDPYANYRAAEQIGVSAWKSCFIRGLEKVQRIANAASGKRLNHESAENSFLDLANHVVIAKVLYDEEQASNSCPCGGNCNC